MLKGYLNCIETKNLLLRYVNFDLNKNQMAQIAQHLRNCPKCTEEYSKIVQRKKILKRKMIGIEKKMRMEAEISSLLDGETTAGSEKTIVNMIITDKNYKKEFNEMQKMLRLLHFADDKRSSELNFKNSDKILAKIRLKKISANLKSKSSQKRKPSLQHRLTQVFELLRRALSKFV